jgi:hypothetical protein
MSNTVPSSRLTLEQLLTLPLSALLARLHAKVVEVASVDDSRYYGHLFALTGGDVILAVPPNRPLEQRDTAVRFLLGSNEGLPVGALSAGLAA